MVTSPLRTLTGSRNIDQEILLYLDDGDLFNLSLTSKYFYRLCQEDTLWCQKLKHNSLKGVKYPSLTWKQWYFFWKKHENALLLITTKNLTPEQAYVFLMSCQGHILPGSEIYQTLDCVLIKAMKKRDNTLLNKFLNKFNLLYGGPFDKIPFCDMVVDDYVDVIKTALENDYYDIACLVGKLFRRHSLIVPTYYHLKELVEVLGKIAAEKFYEEEIKPHLEIGNLDEIFLIGLIEGYHNSLAEAYYLKGIKGHWNIYLNTALENKNKEFIAILKKHIPRKDCHRFNQQYTKYHTHDTVWNNKDYSGEYFTCQGIVILEVPHYHHELQEKYYQSNVTEEEFEKRINEITNWQNYTFKIDYNTVSCSKLLWFYEKVKPSSTAINLVLDAINHGYCDFIFSLNDHSITSSQCFWDEFFMKTRKIKEKGVYLYFVMLLMAAFPDKVKDYIDQRLKSYIQGSYEIYLLNTILFSSFPSPFNMYDLLTKVFSSPPSF